MAWKPDRIFRRIEDQSISKEEQSIPYVKRAISHLKGKKDSRVELALNIYRDDTQKDIIEAYLICEQTIPYIAEQFIIDPEVLEIYSIVFFDTSSVDNRLDKLSYVRSLEEGSMGRRLKEGALKGDLGWLNSEISEFLRVDDITNEMLVSHRTNELANKTYKMARDTTDHRKIKDMTETFLGTAEAQEKHRTTNIRSSAVNNTEDPITQFKIHSVDATKHINDIKAEESTDAKK